MRNLLLCSAVLGGFVSMTVGAYIGCRATGFDPLESITFAGGLLAFVSVVLFMVSIATENQDGDEVA